MAIELLSSEQTLNFDIIEHRLLQSALLNAETLGELTALIVNYTHWEIMQAFERLPLSQQQRVQELWEVNIPPRWQ